MSGPTDSFVLPAVPSGERLRLELRRLDPPAAELFYCALGLTLAVEPEVDTDDSSDAAAAPPVLECSGLELTIHPAKKRSAETPTILRFFVADLAAAVSALVAQGGTIMKPRESPPPEHRAVVHDGHATYLVLVQSAHSDRRSLPVSFRSTTIDSYDRRALRRSLWFVGIGALIIAVCCGVLIAAAIVRFTGLDHGKAFRTVAPPFCFGVVVGLVLSAIGKFVRRPLRGWLGLPSLTAAAGLDVVAIAAWCAVPLVGGRAVALACLLLGGAAAALSAALYLRCLGRLASLGRLPACRHANSHCLGAWSVAAAVSAAAAVFVFRKGLHGSTFQGFFLLGVTPFVIWIIYYVVVLLKSTQIEVERSIGDVAE